MNYNITNIELDSIIESFNMDIFIIEHNNFINIINKRINGEILNESIIQEGVKEKVKEIINKFREAFKKLIAKVKEISEKIKKAIQSKFFSLAFNDLKKLPDDIDLGKRTNIDWLIGNCIPFIKKSDQNFLQICDKISKIDIKNIASANQDIDDIRNIRDKYIDEWNQMVEKYNEKLSSKISYTGKYLKTQYPKIILTSKNLLKSSDNDSLKLYKSLMQADRKIDDLGKNFTYSTDPTSTMAINIKYGRGNYIDNREYNGDDKNNSVEFVKFGSKYIKLYADLCKDLTVYTHEKYIAARDCLEIVLKGLSLLGDNAKKHTGYNYNRGSITYNKGTKYDPDPDFYDDFDDFFED